MRRCIRPIPRDDSAGFTLLETLVALLVTAVVLGAIGQLMAVNARTTRDLDQRLSLLQTARAVLGGLPDRQRLSPGSLTGTRADHDWRIDVMPFAGAAIDPHGISPWEPETVVVQVRSPSGQVLRLDTIRLRRTRSRDR